MSCRPFSVMLASMPAGTNSTVAIEGKQLLLTIGRAGVLSSRADCRWGAGYAAAPPRSAVRTSAERPQAGHRYRPGRGRRGDLLAPHGRAVPHRRTPMPWRACKRRWHEHRHPQARAGLAPQLARSSDTSSVRHARRSHRLGRAHRRADPRSLAARCAALRRAATAPQCDATERQEHSGRAQGRLDGAAGRPRRGGLAVAASVRLPVPQARPPPCRLRGRLPARDA